MPRKLKDLTGHRFDTQLVLGRARDRIWESDSGPRRQVYWWVRCSACRQKREVQATTLKNGTKCPCQRKKNAKKMVDPEIKEMSPKTLAAAVSKAIIAESVSPAVYEHIMRYVLELKRRSE
jgi:hypothetical protein